MRRALTGIGVMAVLAALLGCSSVIANSGGGPITATTTPTATVASATPAATETPPTSSVATPPPPPPPPAKPPAKPAAPSKALHHPALGSAERKAIMDGLRPTIQKDLGQPVIFKVFELNVADDFAFAHVEPLTPSGNHIDFRKTHYRSLVEEGDFDGGASTFALLHYRSGSWKVKTFVIGPTDVAYGSWWYEYDAPKSIFPYNSERP
jgi:hypothetical protein